MTNNIQMFQYNGLEYNQLNPNLSNLSNNSNQLGGVDSSQYATKEYVDKDKIKWNLYQSKTFSNVVDNSTDVLLDNTKIDELKDSEKVKVVFDNVVFSSIPSSVNYASIIIKITNYNTHNFLSVYKGQSSWPNSMSVPSREIIYDLKDKIFQNASKVEKIYRIEFKNAIFGDSFDIISGNSNYYTINFNEGSYYKSFTWSLYYSS